MAPKNHVANPYVYERPIRDPSKFFGRKELIRKILRSVTWGECTSVVAARGVGKTSLLYQLMNEHQQAKYLQSDYGLVFAYVDCKSGLHTPGDFFSTATKSIERETSSGVEVDDIDCFRFASYLKDLEPREVVLLLDDFDCLAKQPGFTPGFYTNLRIFAQRYVRIVTATETNLCYCTPDSSQVRSSPFFNIFLSEMMGLLSAGELTNLVEKTSKRSGISLEEFEDDILRLSGGLPFLVQLTCWHFYDYLVHHDSTSPSKVASAVRERIRAETQPYFTYLWERLDGEEKDTAHGLATGEEPEEFALSVLYRLERTGYVINGELFSSSFRDFVKQST